MDEKYLDVINYVNKASELAATIERDVKAGKKISSATVLALSNFAVAEKRVRFLLDQVARDNVKLN